jgi:hypothetical protein
MCVMQQRIEQCGDGAVSPSSFPQSSTLGEDEPLVVMVK